MKYLYYFSFFESSTNPKTQKFSPKTEEDFRKYIDIHNFKTRLEFRQFAKHIYEKCPKNILVEYFGRSKSNPTPKTEEEFRKYIEEHNFKTRLEFRQFAKHIYEDCPKNLLIEYFGEVKVGQPKQYPFLDEHFYEFIFKNNIKSVQDFRSRFISILKKCPVKILDDVFGKRRRNPEEIFKDFDILEYLIYCERLNIEELPLISDFLKDVGGDLNYDKYCDWVLANWNDLTFSKKWFKSCKEGNTYARFYGWSLRQKPDTIERRKLREKYKYWSDPLAANIKDNTYKIKRYEKDPDYRVFIDSLLKNWRIPLEEFKDPIKQNKLWGLIRSKKRG